MQTSNQPQTTNNTDDRDASVQISETNSSDPYDWDEEPHTHSWSEWQPPCDKIGGGYHWRECWKCGVIQIQNRETEE